MSSNLLLDRFLTNNFVKFLNNPGDGDLNSYIKYCVEKSNPDLTSDGLFMEFGVFTGNTFLMIRRTLPKKITLYGFDTFTGLPEDWVDEDTNNIIFPKGAFVPPYKMNPIQDCELIEGDIFSTLQPFLDTHAFPIKFVHFDMDLYKPTKYALKLMCKQFIEGTVLVFDDFYNLPGWRHHSFKAVEEMIDIIPFYLQPIATLGWDFGWASAAFILKEK